MGALHLIGKAYFASGALLFGTMRGRGGIYSPGALFGVEGRHNLRHGRTVPHRNGFFASGVLLEWYYVRRRGGIYSPGALFGVKRRHQLRHGRTAHHRTAYFASGALLVGTMFVRWKGRYFFPRAALRCRGAASSEAWAHCTS